MKAPAVLAITGALLLYVDFMMSAYLEVTTSGRVGYAPTMLPWLLAFVLLAAGTLLALVRGPGPVRLAAGLWALSLALFLLAMLVEPQTVGRPGPRTHHLIPPMDPAFAVAAFVFLVLAVVQGIRAYRAKTEQAPSPA